MWGPAPATAQHMGGGGGSSAPQGVEVPSVAEVGSAGPGSKSVSMGCVQELAWTSSRYKAFRSAIRGTAEKPSLTAWDTSRCR